MYEKIGILKRINIKKELFFEVFCVRIRTVDFSKTEDVMIRAVLFDMDGTVFDTERYYFECLAEAASGTELEKDLSEVLIQISGMNRHDIYAYLHKRYGEDFPAEALFDERDRRVIRRIREEGLPFKAGFPKVFEDLRNMGILITLATSTHRERMEWYLEMTDLTHTFDSIMTGESVEHSKPAPDIFLQGAERIGCKPEECVVVEDSRNGVLAGVRANMKVVMVPDMQPATPDLLALLWHCLPTIETLPALIAKENEKSLG